jgi:hypothetical protein
MNKEFLQLTNNKFKFHYLFMLRKLPATFFSGVRLVSINEQQCIVNVTYKWFSQNPFKSTYFACLSMAAEMSTGVLALGNIWKRKPGISMLVVSVNSHYFKKATDITTFTCNDGALFAQKIEEAITTKEAITVTSKSEGYNKVGELVASFDITWSFKVKSN